MLNSPWQRSNNPACSINSITDFTERLKQEFRLQALLDFHDITDTDFFLALIVVFHTRRGTGSEIMKRITDFCDMTGARCHLHPHEDFGTPYTILIDFYNRHGFEFNGFNYSKMTYRPKKQGFSSLF